MIKEIYGHRGARGLFAENTLEGFEKTAQMPVKGIELDIVVSMDEQLVVSHEPWMNHHFCTNDLGEPILAGQENKYNLFKMDYAKIQEFDCGNKRNSRFPFQQLFPATKPLLSEVFQMLASKKDAPHTLLLEIKSDPEWYGRFQPRPNKYAKLIVNFLDNHSFDGQLIIQSFDPQLLNAIYKIKPYPNMGLLVENRFDVESNLATLNFMPAYYNVYHAHVTKRMYDTLTAQEINVIPWTVNSEAAANRLAEIGITGIITDYPDLFL